jgi:hypothetical protein
MRSLDQRNKNIYIIYIGEQVRRNLSGIPPVTFQHPNFLSACHEGAQHVVFNYIIQVHASIFHFIDMRYMSIDIR